MQAVAAKPTLHNSRVDYNKPPSSAGRRNRTMLARLLLIFCLVAVAVAATPRLDEPDHELWNALLAEYVDGEARVDYARLQEQAADRLDAYAEQLAHAAPPDPTTPRGKALLINAYNALVVRWIVENYPTNSIMATPNPFRKARHTVAGETISLHEIESRLRATGDARIHAAIVCAARSCPPLRAEAYFPERVDEQLDDNTRRWLAAPELNEFDAAEGRAEVSAIFDWYEGDFTTHSGGLEEFVRQYAPSETVAALGDRKLRFTFKDYHWGLNDQSDVGAEYSNFRLALDWVKNWFR